MSSFESTETMLSQLLNKAFSFVSREIFRYISSLLQQKLFATRLRKINKKNSNFRNEKNIVQVPSHREKTAKACQELKQFTNGMAIVSLIQLKQYRATIAFTLHHQKRKRMGFLCLILKSSILLGNFSFTFLNTCTLIWCL